jgi:hypothetical protein
MSGSGIIAAAYIAYALAAIFVFSWRPPLQASLISCFAGWLFLPVCDFPPETLTGNGFTVEVIGIVLPSILGVTKAFVVSAVVLILLAWKDRAAIRRFKAGPLDWAMAAFCVTPLLPALAGFISISSGLSQSLYLAVVWGATWMIGRLTITSPPSRASLAVAMVAGGAVLVPIALIEGIQGPWIYSSVYGVHPFQAEGASRYLGHRPIGFFEHGNQYGIWMAMAALAAVHMALISWPRLGLYALLSVLLIAAAVASQSVGAILLLAIGICWLVLSSRWRKIALVSAALLLAVGGPAYLTGRVPIQQWAETTPIAQKAITALKLSGRASLGYRLRRDQIALPLIYRAPLTGYGVWDWWRPLGSHPWGLPLLLAGQFGLLALALLTFALFGGTLRELAKGRGGMLPIIVVAAGIDAWLNSYLYIPAILAAAAMAVPLRRRSENAPAETGPSSSTGDMPAKGTSVHAG